MPVFMQLKQGDRNRRKMERRKQILALSHAGFFLTIRALFQKCLHRISLNILNLLYYARIIIKVGGCTLHNKHVKKYKTILYGKVLHIISFLIIKYLFIY